MYKYCSKCGAELIKLEVTAGTYGKLPLYFNTHSGKPYFNAHYSCPNQTFFGSHDEYYINFTKEN